MNEMILKEMTREKIIYLYRPSGEGEFGEIVYTFIDDATSVIKKAENDILGKDAHRAELQVKDCVKRNNLPLKCVQAWH